MRGGEGGEGSGLCVFADRRGEFCMEEVLEEARAIRVADEGTVLAWLGELCIEGVEP